MQLDGLQLGRYKVIQRIGGGGMGDVYLAEDPQISQKVAIKVIRTEATLTISQDTMKLLHEFQEEARAIAQLDHPHILPLLSYGEEQIRGDTVAFIVMPYRKEGNLITWMQQLPDRGIFTPIDLVHLIQQAASALQYAHDHNVLHRDIKPSNFLVRENNTQLQKSDLLLADFGLAKLMDASSQTSSHKMRGTPAYMAPEQWMGQGNKASDQYALAIMAYELLVGRTPFQGNPFQMMNLHVNTPAPAPSTFNASLPAKVDQVLLRALSKQPSERYPSIADFADGLLHAFTNEDDVRTVVSQRNEVINNSVTEVDSEHLAQVQQAQKEDQARPAETPTILPTPLAANHSVPDTPQLMPRLDEIPAIPLPPPPPPGPSSAPEPAFHLEPTVRGESIQHQQNGQYQRMDANGQTKQRTAMPLPVIIISILLLVCLVVGLFVWQLNTSQMTAVANEQATTDAVNQQNEATTQAQTDANSQATTDAQNYQATADAQDAQATTSADEQATADTVTQDNEQATASEQAALNTQATIDAEPASKDFTVVLNRTFASKYATYNGTTYPLADPVNTYFLSVSLSLENASSQQQTFSLDMVSLDADSGNSYTADSTVSGPTGYLNPGQSSPTMVVFVVQSTDCNFTITFNDPSGNDDTWTTSFTNTNYCV